MPTALSTSLSSPLEATTSKQDDKLQERTQSLKLFVNPAKNEKPFFGVAFTESEPEQLELFDFPDTD